MLDLLEFDDTVFKDRIDISTLDHSSKFYQLWSLWKEYIDFQLVGNKHLKLIGFFNLIGIILTHKGYGFAKDDLKVPPRLHWFMFQRSRSGKGQLMKAKHKLLDFCGIPTRYTTKDNEPSAMGTCSKNEKTGKVDIRRGYCSFIYDYNWDEGGIILRTGKRNGDVTDDMTDMLQAAMDDPGFISKGMAWDSIGYKTDVTLTMGSYMTSSFSSVLMRKGLFQRMIITFKEFDEQEKQTMRTQVPLLKLRYNPQRILRIKQLFKEIIDSIPNAKDTENKGVLKHNKVDMTDFVKFYDDVYYNILSSRFMGRTQEILESFGDTVFLIVDKIALQKAVIEGRTEIIKEDMQVALPVVKLHIGSLLDLFNYIDPEKRSSNDIREREIYNIVKEKNRSSHIPVTRTIVMLELDKKRNLNEWDLGKNNSLKLINDLIKKGLIQTELRDGIHSLKVA